MRVTKVIKEFIEETVHKAIPTDYEVVAPEYYAMDKKVQDARDEMTEEIEAYITKRCAEKRKELGLPDDWKFYLNDRHYSYIWAGGYDSALYEQANMEQKKAMERRDEAIKKIILELELGATRAELDSIIQAALAK